MTTARRDKKAGSGPKGLTEEQKQEIREAFDLFDTDGSGTIDAKVRRRGRRCGSVQACDGGMPSVRNAAQRLRAQLPGRRAPQPPRSPTPAHDAQHPPAPPSPALVNRSSRWPCAPWASSPRRKRSRRCALLHGQLLHGQ